MSFARLSVSRWRGTFAWSNSAQSWIERACIVVVGAAAVLLWYLGDSDLPFTTQLLCWALLLLTAGMLQRFGYLPIFGPVLFYDMIRTARRNRYVLMRTLYAGFLLLLLFSIYTAISQEGLDNRAQASRLAADFFEYLMMVQLIAVILLTPAYVGGAVAEEKERRTLEFILATDLRNQEVILSKLGSRLANLALFLLTSLPILSLLQFLGGIDPNLVLMGFAVTGLTMLGAGSVSLFYSVVMRRSRDAIACTYLFMLAYFGLATLLLAIDMAGGWGNIVQEWFNEVSGWLALLIFLVVGSLGLFYRVVRRSPSGVIGYTYLCLLVVIGAATFVGHSLAPADVVALLKWFTGVFNAGSPLALIIRVQMVGQQGALASELPGMLRDYASFHFVLVGLGLGWSILFLRRAGLKQTVGREARMKDPRQSRPPVGELPMLWKELLEPVLLSWPALIAFVVLGLLTLGIGLWICADYVRQHLSDIFFGDPTRFFAIFNTNNGIAREMNIWARLAGGAVACVTLLWVAVRASTAISGERDRQTLDALITTQLGSDAMLGAKLLGSVLGVRLGLAWLASILLLASLTGGLHPFALPIVLGEWCVYACFFALVGLFCSLVCSTSTKATVATVLVSIALAVGHWLIWMCLGPLLYFTHSANNDGPAELIWKFQFGMSPPCVLIMSMFSYEELAQAQQRDGLGEILAYCLLGLCLWTAACILFWFGSLAPRFRMLMRREHGYAE